MKLYSVWHEGCGKTRMFEAYNKQEAVRWIADNGKGYEQNFHIHEQGKDDIADISKMVKEII